MPIKGVGIFMNWTAFFGIGAPYTKQELYELWFKFRDDPNAPKILSDFMGSDIDRANELIDEFESRLRYDLRYQS